MRIHQSILAGRCLPACRPGLRLALAILCTGLWDGCGTEATGTKQAMNADGLSKIDQLEVQVGADRDFSVVLEGQKVYGLDVLLIPVALTGAGGMGAAAGVDTISIASKAAVDARRAKELRQAIADVNPRESVQQVLVAGLRATARFKSVTAADAGAGLPPDCGVFHVQIERWGLNSDKSDDRKLQLVQVGLNATATLTGGDGQVIWEHKDYFTGDRQRSFSEYRDSPGLLKSEINETIQRYCTRLVNEIRYAR